MCGLWDYTVIAVTSLQRRVEILNSAKTFTPFILLVVGTSRYAINKLKI